MQASNIPAKVAIPFASGASAGYVRPIPATQPGGSPGTANFTTGFPPECFVPLGAGGVPPNGEDFNGILLYITEALQWLQAGGLPGYDSTFSTAIGGYPSGAIVARANGHGFWISTVDNNTSDPDTGGAHWNVCGVGSFNGRTGDITPASGDYTVSQVTGAVASSSFADHLGTNGYQQLPGGLILQWGYVTNTNANAGGAGFTLTFPTPFPNTCVNAQATVYNAGGNTSSIDAVQIAGLTASTLTVFSRTLEANMFWFAIGY